MKSRDRLVGWLLLSLALNIGTSFAERKNWAVLIAGSKGWGDYGQQANICHTYQILHAQGIPDEQIIVFMYDDIAYSELNPYPGELINKRGGPNVYTGVKKDYTGEEVTAEVFYKVLQGDKEGIKQLLGREGKVLESGPEDYVFISYVDHGSIGIVFMPAGPYMYATDLNEVLKKMHAQKKYDKLVFYMDACYSGSMFDGLLPDDINIYGATPCSADTAAYKWYKDEERNTYLSTEWGAKWMENCDNVDITKETLQEQFDTVKEEMGGSVPYQYGDLSWTSLTVGDFLGNGPLARLNSTRRNKAYTGPKSPVCSDDSQIETIKDLLAGPMGRKFGKKLSQSLEEHLWLREKTQQLMEDVARNGLPGQDSKWVFENLGMIKDWDCYKPAVESLIEQCPLLSPSDNRYLLQRLNVLVNLCNTRPKSTVMEAIEKASRDSILCVQ